MQITKAQSAPCQSKGSGAGATAPKAEKFLPSFFQKAEEKTSANYRSTKRPLPKQGKRCRSRSTQRWKVFAKLFSKSGRKGLTKGVGCGKIFWLIL